MVINHLGILHNSNFNPRHSEVQKIPPELINISLKVEIPDTRMEQYHLYFKQRKNLI